MYSKDFVLAVKAGGKVLREFDNSVYLPFGTEYSILLKNLSTRRAKVQVFIDGEDALDGNSIIIDPKKDVDLKRFIRNSSATYENPFSSEGNAFKFIEKTEKISKHRGDRADDGLITITYEFENRMTDWTFYSGWQEPKSPQRPYNPYQPDWAPPPTVWGGTSIATDDIPRAMYSSSTITMNAADVTTSHGPLRGVAQAVQSPQGVTAPGSVVKQEFTKASHFYPSGEQYSMTVQLKGGTYQEPVKAPVTVKKLTQCPMCGTHVKQTAKFCHECGSSVVIV